MKVGIRIHLAGLALIAFGMAGGTVCRGEGQGFLRSRVDALLLPLVEKEMVSGSVLIARQGEIVLARGYGLANREHGIQTPPETPYRIASVSKSLTATAVMQLIDRGQLELEDALSKYLSDYPNGDRITIADLLSHSSGIPSDVFVEGFREKSLQRLSLEETVSWFENEPLRFEPGDRFEYSNSGYVLLSLVIERVSGLPLEQYLRRNIFEPAEMTTSGLDAAGLVIAGRASGYSRSENGAVIHAAYRDPSFGYGAGALFSSAVDLYRFQAALDDGKLLSTTAREAMLMPRFETPWGNKYSYGWFLDERHGRPVVLALGGTSGFMATLQHFTDEDVLVVVLLNQDFMLHERLYRALTAIALGLPWEPVLPAPDSPSVAGLAKCAGEYLMEDGIKLQVALENGRIYLEEQGRERRFEIRALSETTGYVAAQNARLSFRQPDDGGPLELRALYGVLLWTGQRVSKPAT